MAKASAVLWKHKTDPAGHHPIYLRFTDSHRTLYASIAVAIAPRHWNPKDKARPVRKSHPHADAVNGLITARLATVEAERLRLLTAGERVSAEALKAALAPRVDAADPCFLGYVEAFLVGVEKAGNVQRVDKERGTLAKLRGYLSGTPTGPALKRLPAAAREAAERKAAAVRLPFSKLTPELLHAFTAHLTGTLGNSAATVRSNVTMIRAHVRRAMRDSIVTRDADPFFNYSPPRVARSERARLTADEIARLDALDLGLRGPAGSLPSRVRDAFLFALYAAGVRFADLVRLRVSDVHPGADGAFRLAYTAGKSGKRTSAPLVGPAERIVAPYLARLDGTPKDGADYLFPALVRPDGSHAYDLTTPRGMDRAVASQNALHNKTLKRLATLADVRATLSMHVARHSFADLARRGGWSVYDVKQALRHSSVAVTEGYLAGFDSEALDVQTRALFPEPPADA